MRIPSHVHQDVWDTQARHLPSHADVTQGMHAECLSTCSLHKCTDAAHVSAKFIGRWSPPGAWQGPKIRRTRHSQRVPPPQLPLAPPRRKRCRWKEAHPATLRPLPVPCIWQDTCICQLSDHHVYPPSDNCALCVWTHLITGKTRCTSSSAGSMSAPGRVD